MALAPVTPEVDLAELTDEEEIEMRKQLRARPSSRGFREFTARFVSGRS